MVVRTTVDWLAMIFVIVGGLNWGLIGLFNYDIVAAIFGGMLSRIIYVLVGLAALYMIYFATKTGSMERQKAMPDMH